MHTTSPEPGVPSSFPLPTLPLSLESLPCPTAPNNHGPKNSSFCDECGAETVNAPPATGDKLNIRSPEAHANAHSHIYMPGAVPESKPILVDCPKCGRYNPRDKTFNCKGGCTREHLCLRHFDEDYDVCVDCARALRKVDEQEAASLRKLEAERDKWQGQAQKAETALVGLKSSGRATQKQLEQNQKELSQARTRVQAAQTRVSALEKDLAQWRKRAENAETKLAEIERKRRGAPPRSSVPSRSPAAGRSSKWQQIGIELIKIPAGEFLYGDDKKKVYLGDYHLAKTPVTNAQYKAFVDATDHYIPDYWEDWEIPNGKENHPVVEVGWDDAQAFCQWAGLRLPTEQEWEKGARGTDGREYPWGNQKPNASLCNYGRNVGDTTSVDRYSGGASPYGLLDMAGNVWDWCEDWYDSDHKTRVLRGGSWNIKQLDVRSASRFGYSPDYRFNYIGFRCAAPS